LRRIFNYLVGLLVSQWFLALGLVGFGWLGRVLVFRAGKQGLVAAGHFRAFGSDWFWLVGFGWFLADRKRARPDAQQGARVRHTFSIGGGG
jgi:hypothetical protein